MRKTAKDLQFVSLPTIYPIDFAQKGGEIYKKISGKLEKKYRGKFLAIDVESEKYFLGETQEEAVREAKKHFPTKIFYFVKIGFPGTVTVSANHRPVSYGNVL